MGSVDEVTASGGPGVAIAIAGAVDNVRNDAGYPDAIKEEIRHGADRSNGGTVGGNRFGRGGEGGGWMAPPVSGTRQTRHGGRLRKWERDASRP
jgi:hypothetical protein